MNSWGLGRKYGEKYSNSHLEESFSTWGSGFQHNGENGENNNLDGRSTGIPVWARNTILKLEKKYY